MLSVSELLAFAKGKSENETKDIEYSGTTLALTKRYSSVTLDCIASRPDQQCLKSSRGTSSGNSVLLKSVDLTDL